VAEDTLNIHIRPSKLNPPKVDRRWVLRSRLILRLNEGLKKRLTPISAPAGYGKTILVVQWMGQVRRNSAWLSLYKNDVIMQSPSISHSGTTSTISWVAL